MGSEMCIRDRDVKMAPDCIGDEVRMMVDSMEPGDVVLLENLRFHPEEKANDQEFSQELASLGDIYISDAFGTAHRAHASMVGVPRYMPHAAGLLLQKEVLYLGQILRKPERPLVVLLGGAKVSSKIGVIENLLNEKMERGDTLLIGGAMAYTFLKAKGIEVGDSLVEEDKVAVAREILALALKKGVEVILPVDHLVAREIKEEGGVELSPEVDIPPGMKGVDIGPGTIRLFKKRLRRARTIFWNGPVGLFEIETFSRGTREIAQFLAELTQQDRIISIVGGGDTVAAVSRAGVKEKLSHVSTGGGASLQYMEGKTLPGIEAVSGVQPVSELEVEKPLLSLYPGRDSVIKALKQRERNYRRLRRKKEGRYLYWKNTPENIKAQNPALWEAIQREGVEQFIQMKLVKIDPMYQYQPFIYLDEKEEYVPIRMNFSGDWDILRNKEKYDERFKGMSIGEVAAREGGVYCYRTSERINNKVYDRYLYIYYYPFDSGYRKGTHRHEVEHVSVYVNRETGEVDYVGTGEHENVHFYHARSSGIKFVEGTHPVIYIARGSHAMVPRKKDFAFIDRGYCRNYSFGGTLPCLLYTSPSPRDLSTSRMPSSA